MNVLRTDTGGVHLPVRNYKYPFDIIDYPYPLCGMTGSDASYKFVTSDADCDQCARKAEYIKKKKKGKQISFAI